MGAAASGTCRVGGPASLVFRRATPSESVSSATRPHASRALEPLVRSSRGATPPPPIDASALAAWVTRAPTNRLGATPYAGIDVDHVTMPPRERSALAVPNVADAPSFLRRALVDAVEVALDGVRRVAVMTGGGLDSSVLLGLATEWATRTGGSAFAVSLDFEGPGDDRPHLAALERHLGCEVVRVKPEEAAPRIALLPTGADAMPIPFSSMPMEIELCSRARAHGAERVISGAGGDELFGGSPQALADLAWRGHPVRAARAARRLAGFGRPRSPTWSWVGRPLVGRFVPERVHAWRARRQPAYAAASWLGPVARAFLEEAQRLDAKRAAARPRTPRQRYLANRDDAHRVVLAWARHQEEQASGVDCWDPYLDLDLASAVTSLPPDYLLFGDRWRGLLRAATRDLLPDGLRERMDKASFEPALRRFMDAAGGLESLRPLSSGHALAALGLVEPEAFAEAFERFVATPDDGISWVGLWSALSIEAFLRGRAS
jgi:asparagine synthase (glutamine-hydrolysing)